MLTPPPPDSGHPPPAAHLARLLAEQGESPADRAALALTLGRLASWAAPAPTAMDTARLLTQLESLLPPPSLVRQALRARRTERGGELTAFLDTALAQVELVRPAFWLTSAALTGLGLVIALLAVHHSQALILRVMGPLLAVLALTQALRGLRLRVLELELSCPLSPARLILARLVIVLGYDLGLGLLMSVVLGAGAGQTPLPALVLHWLAPLLLVAGVALLLSSRLRSDLALTLTYSGWLALLALTVNEGPDGPLSIVLTTGEAVLALLGLILLGVALLRLRAQLPLLLPRSGA